MSTLTDISEANSVNDYYTARINTLKENLLKNIVIINNKFNINLTVDIEVKDNTIIINGNEDFSFVIYKWFKLGKKGSSSYSAVIKLDCPTFPFYPYQAVNATFSLCVDDDFNICSAIYKGLFNVSGIKSSFVLNFDKNLNFERIVAQSIGLKTKQSYSIDKENGRLCSLSDESLLFKFYLHQNKEEVKEMLPECFVPSAYDFNSVDFKDRLKLFDMVIC